jgi:hypothetical protein
LISEIRNYLYGGLTEQEIWAMLRKGKKLRRVKGLMSFYALLDEKEGLQELDGWLASTVRRAMQSRASILASKHGTVGLTPSSRALITGTWMDLAAWRGDPKPDLRLPSYVCGWRAARKYYFTFGLKDVEPLKYGYQYAN